jgi:hypothetical protein
MWAYGGWRCNSTHSYLTSWWSVAFLLRVRKIQSTNLGTRNRLFWYVFRYFPHLLKPSAGMLCYHSLLYSVTYWQCHLVNSFLTLAADGSIEQSVGLQYDVFYCLLASLLEDKFCPPDHVFFSFITVITSSEKRCSLGTVDHIATAYGMDGWGVGVRVPVGRRIFSSSRPILGHI